MQHSGRFGVALAVCIALGVASVAATISMAADNAGLDVAELVRVEPLPDESASDVDANLVWMFEIFGGERRWTEADLATRFTPGFAAGFTADGLNRDMEAMFEDPGPVRFVRVSERTPELLRAVGVAGDGTPMTAWITTVADGRMESLGLDEAPAPSRLRPWEATLVLLTGWLFLAAAVASSRAGAEPEAWASLIGSVSALAAVLVLSNSALGYAAGRTVPGLLLPTGVLLLMATNVKRHRRLAVSVAAAAGLAAAIAPLTRDSTLIGHPPIRGSFSDSDILYRTLLAASEGFIALALLVVVATAIRKIRRSNRWRRPPLLGTAAIATMWAGVGAVSFIDYIVGAGRLAERPLTAATWSAIAAIPVIVVFRLVVSRWDRPELASLVIDLETDGTELQPAVARALDDPSLQLLTSPDGRRLEDRRGHHVHAGCLPDGRAISEIRSGSRLIGALVHDSALKRDPGRVRAVAAAAGLALDVSRLNEQVTSQLDEVNASRTRIIEANDTARRRLERDLHDGAQQRLVALGLDLQRARRQANTGATVEELAAQLDAATAEVRDAVNEIRAVSKGARPALLEERGLAAAIDALAARAPVPVAVSVTSGQLPSGPEATAYYVIAEGLTNIAKHAGATTAKVSVTRTNGVAVILIDDDGRGGATTRTGSGLEGLSDRVSAAGGMLNITSGPSGTTLEATIPCE